MDVPGEEWLEARRAAASADHTLSAGSFAAILRLFEKRYARSESSPGALTAEWGREEFLRVVGADGSPALLDEPVLAEYRRAAQQFPQFMQWFAPSSLADGTAVLLAARWLCHLVGLRHLTVEAFIDPPALPGLTLVQVRGMDKFEAPGCFDIPCAGHVSGVGGIEAALEKELGEELALSTADLAGLRLVARYNSAPDDLNRPALNYEYRYLYQASLRVESVKKIRFADGEVGGLCVFSVADLRRLVSRFPERVASGLSDAIDFYS